VVAVVAAAEAAALCVISSISQLNVIHDDHDASAHARSLSVWDARQSVDGEDGLLWAMSHLY
jgi:hypothetical protein